MLYLKRICNPWDWVRSSVTKKPIKYPEYYYEDDEDGYIIELSIYQQAKKRAQQEKFDYSKLQNAYNQREYEEMLDAYTREFLLSNVMNRKVAKYKEDYDS
jgi:TPP-dependent 2-oxoacid decarboxylase